MALPQLTDAERRAALKKAVETRQKRAELKKRIKAGQVSLTQVLNDTSNPVVAKMKISSLLQSLPGVGKARAQKLMTRIGIDESRRIQGLGSKQRQSLLEELR
ncbi:MAG: integration host factor [Actinobacteria bacterium]|nr:MAG: integration host factor [Actinomycetota bacterium]